MKSNTILLLAFLSIISLFQSCNNFTPKPPPNIIYILADDLGYGDLGVYGQKIIETPNIDALAKKGMLFTQHYSGAPVCAPARGVLMTGKHTGNAYVRGNHEWGERGKVWDYMAMFNDPTLEGQAPIPDSTVTLGELLQGIGYKTALVGKWGLGAPHSEGEPNEQGFDFFYGYNCQRQAHTLYPLHLWKNKERVFLNNDTIPPHSKLAKGADTLNPASYAHFDQKEYAPTLMLGEALGFMEANKENPFFLYYASPIPHLPLQAPKNWVAYYQDKLGAEKSYKGNKGYFPCYAPHATYAAMVSYLDEQVGALVDKLKAIGQYENTLIIFTSDNGGTFNVGGADSPYFNSNGIFKNEKGYGKGFVQEGGIRVPMIAHWAGTIEEGSTNDHLSAFWDVLPTICELANVPKTSIPSDIDGISYVPTLMKKEQPKHDFLFWEFAGYGGQQAVRKGKWKAIRRDIIKDKNLTIELYDLEKDIQEQNDVATEFPEIVAEMERIMKEERQTPSLERFKMVALGDKKKEE